MLVFRYPSNHLTGDWMRTVCGWGIGLGMLLFAPWSPWTVAIFGSVTLLFLYFGRRTLERQLQRVALSDEGVAARDWRQRALPWDDLASCRLRYYGGRKALDRLKEGERTTSGFMELTLSDGGTRMKFDSGLEGFGLLAWRSAKAARDGGLPLDPATAGNFLSLGVYPDEDTPPPELAREWREAVAMDGQGRVDRGPQ